MKTAQPGGAGDLVVKVEGGFGVEIPWDRERRRRATFAACGAGPDNRTDGMRSRYERLAGSPWWPELLGHLAAYVSETIPAPDVLGCSLWTATAMTRRACRGGGSSTVLCCISVGNVETLVLFDGAGGPAGFLNMRLPARLPAACRRGDAWLRGASYRSAYRVGSAEYASLAVLAALLSDRSVLDACYRLNAEMLRRGSCMYARNSNAFLIDAILGEVVGRR